MYTSFEETLAAADGVDVVRLPESVSVADATSALASCDGYYVKASRDELPRELHVTEAFLSAMPKLTVVASYGAGYDTVDADACTRAGIAVVNQAGGNAEAVAQHALGMMLTLLKRMPEADRATRRGKVESRSALMGRELSGRTVGLIGLGHVGARVASLLNVAFGCEVLTFDPFVSADECKARGARKVELDELLRFSDIVSVHCPLNAQTRQMFDAPAYAAMREGALFLSTARGSIHDEGALHDALASGHLAGAGLDVWEVEPPPGDHPLLSLDNVVLTPHTAGVTHESRERVARMAAEAFIAAAKGKLPPRVVNPDAVDAVAKRLRAFD